MSGLNALTGIDREVKKWLRLQERGKLTNAQFLEKARTLNIRYNDLPVTLNTLGLALSRSYLETGEQAYLEESCRMYLKAHTLAPSCLWTRLQYCRRLALLGQHVEIWKILRLADEFQIQCDPFEHNAALPEELSSLNTGLERFRYVVDQYEKLRSIILSKLIANLASMTSVECRKQVQRLIAITPDEFKFHHINFVTCLWSAYNSAKNAPRRFLIEQSLDIVDSVSQDRKNSILLCLYRAKILLALGRLGDAESECFRGLQMIYPADPIVDGIFYSMETNGHFDGEFQVKGDTQNARVEYIKGNLKYLLRLITFRLKAHWESLALFDRDSFLTSRFDVLVEYYKELNPSVQCGLNNARTFFETHKQWEYWICPVCSQGLIMSIDKLCSHLRDLHGYKSFDKLACEQKCSEISLWKYQEKLLLTLGDRELFYDMYPAKHTSFDSLKEARSRERHDRFSDFKEAVKNTDEINKLQRQLLKACHISYCEYLVPLLRLYQKAQLLKDATEVFTKKEISKEDMNSVFWATCDESEIHQETEEAGKDAPLQVKYSELDNNYLQYWSEKQNRGYKWFPDADLPDLKEYKLTCFSNASGDPLSQFTEQQAINSDQVTNVQRLIVTGPKVPGCKSALNYAWMTGTRLRSPMVPVAALKKPKEEINLIFHLLNKCQHPNILKPLGVWPDCDDPSMGYIILPRVDGAISTVSSNEIFLVDSNVIDSFSENGLKIFRDVMSGVEYVNTHYSTPLLGGNEVLPHFRLNISLDCIYYIRNVTGEYQIYLGNFTVESPEESKKVNVDELITSNWNAVGISLKNLCDDRDAVDEKLQHLINVDEELQHLINVLMGSSVKYDDLVWEPGMWTVSEKMTFIREVFWIQRSYMEKRGELATKQPLGLDSFAKKLFPDMVRKDPNMLSDFIFLRNKVLGHQDAIYHSYKGPKEDIGISKETVMKFLRKEAPACLINLVEGVRSLKWIILSPFCRNPVDSQRWLESIFPAHKQQPSGPAAQTPQQPPSSS